MNKTFAFRQRAGHLNWKLISSVDIFRIVDDLRIDELQSVLDPVAFCEFSVSDVKRNTVDATTKLIHLMQLMIEYLLYCQESQLQLVKEMDGQNRLLRKSLKACTRDNAAFREDIKIYKRQLALLKQALNNGSDFGDQISYRVINPPVSSEHMKPILEPICAMIESVQRHEKETRDFMKNTLDEQRAAMARLANAENMPVSEDLWDSARVKEALRQQRRELMTTMNLRELELDEREAQLVDRENNVFAAELSLKDREDQLNNQPTSHSIGLNTSIDKDSVRKYNIKFVAMNFLHSTLKASFYKSVNKFFLRWKMNAWYAKIEELTTELESCKGELYAAGIRETRLNALLTSERQHNVLETAKKNINDRKKTEMAVNTSINFGERDLHSYRSLSWAELASRSEYLSSISTAEDMMQRFENKVARHEREIGMDGPKMDQIFRDLAEEMVARANLIAEKTISS